VPPLGGMVSVSRVEVQPAKEIKLSSYSTLSDENVLQLNSSNPFRWALKFSALTRGNYVTLELSGDSKTPGLKLHFQVMQIYPPDANAVYITKDTVFTVLSTSDLDIQERSGQRFVFLKKLYQLKSIGGREWEDALNIGVELGFDFRVVKEIIDYLGAEKLIRMAPVYFAYIDSVYPTFLDISITHKGKKEVELAERRPGKATEHFPKQIFKIAVSHMEIDRSVRTQSFNNITNSSVINDSIVENTFIKIKETYGEDLFRDLNTLKETVEESNDPAAGVIFDKFAEELAKPKPDNSTLNKLLDGMERLLPLVSTTMAVFSHIKTLLP
jgi:hypothetical protein